MHLIMSFAFINMHLDIYRIILVPHKSTDASATRKNSKANFHASLCTKRREGVFRLRLKREVSSTAKQIVRRQQKQNILQRYVQIYISCSITILQKFLQNFCRTVYYKQLSSFRLGFIKLQLCQTSASSSCIHQTAK